MTEKAYQCTTCAKVFETHSECANHADRHRTKPSHNLEQTSGVDYVREVRVERTDTEELTLHQVAGESEPDEPDTEYLSQNDPDRGKPVSLARFGDES
jgi:hypothetical protein